MNVDLQTGVLTVMALVGLQLLYKSVDYFWIKLTKKDKTYVTRDHCKTCAENGEEAVEALSKEILHVKQILLLIGIKVGIPEKNLIALMSVDAGG